MILSWENLMTDGQADWPTNVERPKTSKQNKDFTLWTVSICFEKKKNTLKLYEKVFYNDNYCHAVIPEDDTILKYNQGQKLIRLPFVTYAATKSFIDGEEEIKQAYISKRNVLYY